MANKIDFLISFGFVLQLIIEECLTLPICLSPTFTTGIPKYGISIIPLEELPTTTLEIFANDK